MDDSLSLSFGLVSSQLIIIVSSLKEAIEDVSPEQEKEIKKQIKRIIEVIGEINDISYRLELIYKMTDVNNDPPPPPPLKKEFYRLPILKSLDELGGSAVSSDVIKLVFEKVKGFLNQKDHERLKTGAIRWKNNVRWCRNSLKEEGLLKSNSPHGIWEISYEGRKYLEREYDNWVDRIKKIKENKDNDNNVNKY